VLDALKEALTDKDPSVRAAVAHSIALRNDPVLMPVLLPLFDDAKEAVRLRAAAGYLRLVWLVKPPPAPVKRTLPAKKAVVPASAAKKK
jgi:HEAT repeat protein